MNYKENEFWSGFFYIPAFAPLFFYPLGFIVDLEIAFLNGFFYDNFEIFRRVLIKKGNDSVLVWGYTFSTIFLGVITFYSLVKPKRVIYVGQSNINSMKRFCFFMALFFLCLYIFLNFIDYSDGSYKYVAMIDLSFYFFPLFYFWFLFPLYLSVFFLISLFYTDYK